MPTPPGLRRLRARSVSYVRFDLPGDPPWADYCDRLPGTDADGAARMAVADLPGWMLATEDRELAVALERHGARLVRHARVMRAATGGEPSLVAAEPLASATAPELLASWKRAYAAPHPDHVDGDDERLLAECLDVAFDDAFLGPLHRSSAVIRDDDGAVVAAIVVKMRDDDPPGPWIADLWVDPARQGRGLGTSLVRHAMALLAEDGHEQLGLAVTVGNPAEQRYLGLGFTVAQEAWRLLLPGSRQ